jgi:hypothetical protein
MTVFEGFILEVAEPLEAALKLACALPCQATRA